MPSQNNRKRRASRSPSSPQQSLTPPRRKHRRFDIESLLASPFKDADEESQQQQQQELQEELDIYRYVRKIDCGVKVNRHFRNGKFCTTFVIEELPPNPEQLLYSIFQRCIEEAANSIREQLGVWPDQLGAEVSSPLLDYPIWIPIREIAEDTPDNILNQFLKVIQSRDREGKGNVLGEPFTVRIDTVCAEGLPKVREIRGSGGVDQQHSNTMDHSHLRPVDHGIGYSAMIKVDRQMAAPYCLFYALLLSKQHRLMDRNAFKYYYDWKWQEQREDVYRMLRAAQIPFFQEDYDAVVYVPLIVDLWNQQHAAEGLRFKVFVFSRVGHFKPDFFYGDDKFNTPIAIFHDQDHFHGVRNAGSMLRQGHKYCFTCCTPFPGDKDHKRACKSRCNQCGRVGAGLPCESKHGFRKKCEKCNRLFVNADCYEHHLPYECARNKRCETCGCIWNVRKNLENGRRDHVCGERKCKLCLQWHKPDHLCFIRPHQPKRYAPYRSIVFDVESMQHEPASEKHPEQKNHTVNFIAAHVLCSWCIQHGRWKRSLKKHPCKICGDARTVTFSVRPFHGTKVDRQEVTSDPLGQFVNWIIYELPTAYKTIAFSHYGGRYDMVLAFRAIMDTVYVPQMINRGNKLYELRIPKVKRVRRGRKIENCEVVFRDSYNLIPLGLGRLVNAFGLKIPEKPFFPHLANNPQNLDRVLPHLPPKSDYLYEGMSEEKQREFDPWYEAERHNPFNLIEQLAEYCVNDVEILTEALMRFRDEFFKISRPKDGRPGMGIDVLHDAMTIASACKSHFLLNHLKPNHVGIVPHNGYDHADTQSKIALQYLAHYGDVHGVEVQTALSEGGEHKVGRYKLDGYIAAQDKGIEVNGCHFHAHECMFDDEEFMLPFGKTVGKVRQQDAARLKYLRASLRGGVEVIWECEIRAALRQNKKMREAFKEYRDEGPIRLRDAFFGGRTAPLRLHYQVDPEWEIGYLDFCSLYPSTTATTPYPVGHPTRVIIKRGKQAVNWTRPEDIPVKGILKVFVVPPLKTPIPSLPAKFDDRLLFPLCRSCANRFPKGAVIPDYKCPHTRDSDRGWVATLTSIELAAALEEDGGFRVTRYYRALEYASWDEKLFSGYVAEMMEGKIMASGFPEGVDTAEKQDQFIRENQERFGINIDPSKMESNKALRELMKLMNNNLWARFSLRSDLSKTHLTNSPAELREFLDNRSLHVDRLDELEERLMMITYGQMDQFVDDHNFANVVISLWTTAAARIRLLREMRKLIKAGAVLLYTDTDSLIFAYRKADGCPLQTGWHLGDLQPEYADHNILEFVSSGCKAYGLRMVHKVSGKEKIVLRLRGITLTGDIKKRLHFESFKECVFKFAEWAETVSDPEIEILGEKVQRNDEDWSINLQYPHFLQPEIRTGRVITKMAKKKYRPMVLKGIVTKGKIIKDFGAIE